MTNNLIDRLRGIYTIPVNDGAGPLNGSDTFTREFPVSPIQREAADEIERLCSLLIPLQEIARLTTIYLAGGCCEEHFEAIPGKLYAELRKFTDDSFTELEPPDALPPTGEGETG